MRIVYWAKLQLAKQQIIEALGAMPGVELRLTTSLQETLEALPGADALALAHGPQDEGRQVLDALRAPCNTVRWMHFTSAGREGYEELGWPPGVTVTWAGGGVAPAVAEHAMALMLAIARQVPGMVSLVMAQRKFDRTLVAPKARSLEGSTLVIVGYGHIGRELAVRARAFGMKVISVSRSARQDELVDEAMPLSALGDALARADVIALAIAHTPETTHLIGDAEFVQCKPGALLVNVARGAVIDQRALARALESGRLAGAGIDVTEPEPLPADDPLWDAPNLLISPHFAGSGSPHSVRRLADGLAENARRLMAGEPLQHVVSGG